MAAPKTNAQQDEYDFSSQVEAIRHLLRTTIKGGMQTHEAEDKVHAIIVKLDDLDASLRKLGS